MYYYDQNPAGRRTLLADRSRFLMLNKNQIHRPELKLILSKNIGTARKTRERDIFRLPDKYQSCFYILPKNEHGGAELFHILSKQPKTRVEWQRNHTIDADRSEIALCVYLESTFTMMVSEVF